ncbi:hypothetical protein [Streptomyces sp. NPDC007904]|uniref:hypothetical protein n=1 Tax=Streptomyces sp. NPDC007904 TaxID=3364787 RepID=UPI0036EDCE93
MADEQYRWLDRETAERLLNGEPPEAADPVARDQAERLAEALGALSAPASSAEGELPGEAAALAAFRAVREERAASGAAAGRPSGTRASKVGPVRLGAWGGTRSGVADGPRRRRSVRFSLAAALATGMVGGAAALAGTGVLSLPSGGSGSDPAASVTATGTPSERPLSSPRDGAPGGATPEGGSDGGSRDTAGTAQDGPGGRGDGDTDASDGPGAGADDPSGGGRQRIAAACRALRDGKELNGERRRLVEGAAGGSSRVGTYCQGVLSTGGSGSTTGKGTGQGNGGTGAGDGRSGNTGKTDKSGSGNGNGGNGNGGNGNGGNGNSGNAGNGNGGNGNSGNGNNGNGKSGTTGNGGKNGKGAASVDAGDGTPGHAAAPAAPAVPAPLTPVRA